MGASDCDCHGGVVLLSGGIDSAVVLTYAVQECANVVAITFDYGQRAKEQERKAAYTLTRRFNIEHVVIALDFSQWGGSALTDDNIPIPKEETDGVPVTYVPARNIVFIAVAASFAEARGFDRVYYGANAIDYSGYPDCRPVFVEAMQTALIRGMDTPIELVVPLLNKTKKEIFALAEIMEIPIQETWSCYEGGPEPCGLCPSCRMRQRALKPTI